MSVPRGLVVFGYIFALCFSIAVALMGWWYFRLIRVPGVYSLTEHNSCSVIFLHDDGTYAQRVELYNSGHDDGVITNVVRSNGTWQRLDKTHLMLSGPDFVSEGGSHKEASAVSAETGLRSGLFHTLTVHTHPRDLTYDRPFTGSTACWMVGMS